MGLPFREPGFVLFVGGEGLAGSMVASALAAMCFGGVLVEVENRVSNVSREYNLRRYSIQIIAETSVGRFTRGCTQVSVKYL